MVFTVTDSKLVDQKVLSTLRTCSAEGKFYELFIETKVLAAPPPPPKKEPVVAP